MSSGSNSGGNQSSRPPRGGQTGRGFYTPKPKPDGFELEGRKAALYGAAYWRVTGTPGGVSSFEYGYVSRDGTETWISAHEAARKHASNAAAKAAENNAVALEERRVKRLGLIPGQEVP
jgi:hypothetical protein